MLSDGVVVDGAAVGAGGATGVDAAAGVGVPVVDAAAEAGAAAAAGVAAATVGATCAHMVGALKIIHTVTSFPGEYMGGKVWACSRARPPPAFGPRLQPIHFCSRKQPETSGPAPTISSAVLHLALPRATMTAIIAQRFSAGYPQTKPHPVTLLLLSHPANPA